MRDTVQGVEYDDFSRSSSVLGSFFSGLMGRSWRSARPVRERLGDSSSLPASHRSSLAGGENQHGPLPRTLMRELEEQMRRNPKICRETGKESNESKET